MTARDARPAHVVERGGDRRSLCGTKDPLPVVARRHVAAHVDGRGMIVCPACQIVLDDSGTSS